METIVLEHSDKNIPVGDKGTYLKMFISAVEKFDRNLHWAAFFFLNSDQVPVDISVRRVQSLYT